MEIRQCYPSDTSREQFEQIHHFGRVRARRRCLAKVDLYEVFCSDAVPASQRALKNQVGAARGKRWRSACSAFLIVGAQSVESTGRAEGHETGKMVSAIKRHVAVDTHELPRAVEEAAAEVADRKGTLQAFVRCKVGLDQRKAS